MTNVQKNEIVQAIQEEKKRLGSYEQVAVKVGVSGATISQMINQKWDKIKSAMWQKVAHELEISAQRWNIAETLTFKHISAVKQEAEKQRL